MPESQAAINYIQNLNTNLTSQVTDIQNLTSYLKKHLQDTDFQY